MSTLSLRLPESLHKRLAVLAEREGISINQLITSAVAEKMAALDTEELLATRAARGSRSRFVAALAKVPDAPPAPGDEVPGRAVARTAAKKKKVKLKPRSRKTGAT